jgi:uncharacterized membrane protein
VETTLTALQPSADGLFATVLTFLVLDLKPDVLITGSSPNSAEYLRLTWPSLFNFLLTSVVAGLFWIGHHWIFEHIVVYNRRLLWLNLMFLLCVVLLPFTTALLGVSTVEISIRYASVIILISLTTIIMWDYAYDNQLTDPQLDPKLVQYVRIRHATAPVIFFLSILFEPILHGLVFYFPIFIPPGPVFSSRLMLKPEQSTQLQSNDHQKGLLRRAN